MSTEFGRPERVAPSSPIGLIHRWLLPSLCIALGYVLLALLSRWLGGIADNSAAFWLPIALVYASAIALGSRSWPGIFLGQLGFELLLGSGQPVTGLLLATGNLASAIVITRLSPAAGILQPSPYERQNPFADPSLLIRSFGALLAGSGVNALFGTLAFKPVATDTWPELLKFFGIFVVGDLSGALLLGPLLLKLWVRQSIDWRPRMAEFGVFFVLSLGGLHLLIQNREGWAASSSLIMILLLSVAAALRYPAGWVTVLNAAFAAELVARSGVVADVAFEGEPITSLVVVSLAAVTANGTSLLCAAYRNQAKNSLSEQAQLNELLRHTEAQAQIGSWRFDIRRNRLFWSEQTYRLFGLDPMVSVPDYEHFLALVHPEDRSALDQAWQEALKGQPYDHVHRIVVEGSERWMHERARFEFDSNGRPEQAWGSVQDITERIRLEGIERDRNRAEAANQAKSRFLATLSHEIRTPLNGVIGLLDLLQDAGVDAPTRRAYLQQANHSARLLNDIVSDVLDLSKIEAGALALQTAPYSLHELLVSMREGMRTLAQAKGLTVDLQIAPGTPDQLIGDSVRVRQILQNYLSNALKFTDRGRIILMAESSGSNLRLSVQDTGIGIPGDRLGSLFSPFVQIDDSAVRRYNGTGLGLSICFTLARLMGGTVGVHSRHGEGSTFWAELPMQLASLDATPGPPAPGPVAADQRLKGLRVLMAEDNPVNRVVATRMLERAGLLVTCVHNGQEALDVLRQHLTGATGVLFDIVLLDVHMPEIDGLSLARTYREEERRADPSRRLPLLAMTAGVLQEQREEALAAGMDDFISKPVDRIRLMEVLSRHAPKEVPPTASA